MDQKHALADLLSEMRELLQEIADSITAPTPCQGCVLRDEVPAPTPDDGQVGAAGGSVRSAEAKSFLPGADSLLPGTKSILPGTEWLDRQGVMDYLQISARTYYRLRAQGTLQPHRFGRRDYYFIPELAEPLKESIRRGRI